MADPQNFDRNADDSLVPVTWAEGGTATEPSAGRKSTGWQTGDTVDEATLNWTDYIAMRQIRAFWSRVPIASEAMFTSWMPSVGSAVNGAWAATGINPLEGFLTDGTGTDTKAADVWVDTAGRGAVRVQVSVTKASPKVFPASRSTYVYVPSSMTAPPTVSLADLQFADVPLSDPDPGAPAGTVAVWRVDTDATAVTGYARLIPTAPAYRAISALSLASLGNLDVDGNLTVDGTSTLTGAVATGSTVTAAGQVTAQTTIKGASMFSGTFFDLQVSGGQSINEGYRKFYSHEETATWMESFRVSERTFAWSGTVAGGGGNVDNAITDTTASNDAYFFADLPSSCHVSFMLNVQIWVGDGFAIADKVDETYREVSATMTRNAGTWTNGGIGQKVAIQETTAVPITLVLDGGSTDVLLRMAFPAAHGGFQYRAIAHITAKVIELG